jgi:hypothetical protein
MQTQGTQVHHNFIKKTPSEPKTLQAGTEKECQSLTKAE